VRVNETGHYEPIPGVDHDRVRREGEASPDLGDAIAVDKNRSVLDDAESTHLFRVAWPGGPG
jgi:hypothetical protein